MTSSFALRPYQQDGVRLISEAFQSRIKRVLYQLVTGGGKTIVFCNISQRVKAKGKSVLILVHRDELLMQTSNKLTSQGVSHGIIAPGFSTSFEKVQVASVQTLVRRLDRPDLPHFDLIVIDEAHHAVAGNWLKILDRYKDSFFLGVTATPARLDGKGLGGVFQTLILGPSMKELRDLGHISPYQIYTPEEDMIDRSAIRKNSKGEFRSDDVDDVMSQPKIVGCVLQQYTEICAGQTFVGFAHSVERAEQYAAQFRAAGFRVQSVDGNMDKDLRRKYIQQVGTGELHGIWNCQIISEGTDIPAVSCGILANPTESLVQYLQQVGRTLRPAPGKTIATILDPVGNTGVHGVPDEDREWTLEKGIIRQKSKDKVIRSKKCPSCRRTISAAATKCVYCNHEFVTKGRYIQQVDGKLVLLGSGDPIKRANNWEEQKKRDYKNAKTRQQLEEFAKKYGYKEGWVEHNIENRKAARTKAIRQSYARRAKKNA